MTLIEGWAPIDPLDRAQPSSPASERDVIGSAMCSADALAEIVGAGLRSTDLYQPGHEQTWDAILALSERGASHDPISVSEEMSRRGTARAMPMEQLASMYGAAMPRVAKERALSVMEYAACRRAIAAGTQLVQRAWAPGVTAAELEGLALRAVEEIAAPVDDTTWSVLDDVLELVHEHVEQVATMGRPGGITWGGLADVDKVMSPMVPGEFAVVSAFSGGGKALALDTPLPTPTGWTTMGEVQVGDLVLGADGKPARVTGATGVQFKRECFEVEFSDGTVIVADADHLWLTDDIRSRASESVARRKYQRNQTQQRHAEVRTTREILDTFHGPYDNRLNHSVTNCKPLDLPDADLPIDPYCLGAWLGDGHSYTAQVTGADPEIIDHFARAGYGVKAGPTRRGAALQYSISGGLLVQLRSLGLLGRGMKHIPPAYLRASEQQRRDLLAGLLDTDGFAKKSGGVQFAVTSERLAMDVRELISSLGYRSHLCTKAVRGSRPDTSICYIITFTPLEKVFHLQRKLERQVTKVRRLSDRRMITAIRPTDSVPVKCIQVDNDDHMYLVGPTFIPTHNSVAACGLALHAAVHQGKRVLVHAMEMTRLEVGQRWVAAEARVELDHIIGGSFVPGDQERVDRAYARMFGAQLVIDEVETVGLASLRASIRRHRPEFVVVDQIPTMTPTDARVPREQQVAGLAYGLKRLAKAEGVPILACCQLNANPTKRTDKTPTMHDLRESQAIVQAANTLVILSDPMEVDKDSGRAGEIDWIVRKQRQGPKDVPVGLVRQFHYSRIASMGGKE